MWHACVTASLIAWGPGMILVTAQKLAHTVQDHTSHHEPFLSSGAEFEHIVAQEQTEAHSWCGMHV